MAPHSSTLAWKIPWMEEPGGLLSVGSLRVGHDWVTSLPLFTFLYWRRKWQPLQCSCLENPRDGGAWWAAIYGVAWSRTRLKQLSSSSSNVITSGLRYIPKAPQAGGCPGEGSTRSLPMIHQITPSSLPVLPGSTEPGAVAGRARSDT